MACLREVKEQTGGRACWAVGGSPSSSSARGSLLLMGCESTPLIGVFPDHVSVSSPVFRDPLVLGKSFISFFLFSVPC